MGTLVVVELASRSGLPKDKCVNTFAIAEAGGSHVGKDDAYIDAITDLYTLAVPSIGRAVGELLSPSLSRVASACAIKLYDITDHLDGSPHGSPYRTEAFTLPAAQNPLPLPEEVAYAVRLEALGRSDQLVEIPDGADPDLAPDRPRQRYTGHVYFGPLNAQHLEADVNGQARPNALLGTGLRDAVARAADAIDTDTADEASIGVWSRQSMWIRGIHSVSTDNAWDTQRRRGAQPTSVTTTVTVELVPEVELAA